MRSSPMAADDPAALRREDILRRIRSQGRVTITELAELHSTSKMTAHRDLEQLAREGLVERIRGGARALAPVRAQAGAPTSWEQRIAQAADAKASIAAHTATLVSPGSTIFLDASSTAFAVAVALMRRPPSGLTVVTTSPMISSQIHADTIHVVMCPGELDQQMRAVGGGWTVDFLERLNFEAAFISGSGLALPSGLTTSRGTIADVLRAATRVAARTVALVDATKFGRSSLITIAALDQLDLVITDQSLPAAVAKEYRDAGITLTIVRDHPVETLAS